MVTFKALAASLLLGLVAADECPALSNTFGFKPKNLFELETVDCRAGIQAAECATNLRQSYGQTWAAFRINHLHDCHHGAPYGDCCCFAGDPPIDPHNLEPNPSVWMFFWITKSTGTNEGFGTECIQDPTTGCCGRQDEGKFTVTGDC
ncbi:small secreted protein, partial [Phyllosticta citricarpa]